MFASKPESALETYCKSLEAVPLILEKEMKTTL